MASIGDKSLDRTVARLAGLIALSGVATATSGCLDNAECGVCDPDNLILESFAAINYTGRQVNRVSPPCIGDNCPEPFEDAKRFVDRITDCTTTNDATDQAEAVVAAIVAAREAQDGEYEMPASERTRLIEAAITEYCTFSPLLLEFGLEFVFNNSLEASTIELVRKQPTNFDLFEIYDWKTRIAEVRGPMTRYNGDVREHTTRDGYEITRLVNLTCIENLGRQPEPGECDGSLGDEQPLRMQMDGVFKATRGRWDARPLGLAAGNDCEDPETGLDECCSYCDYALSVKVAKYGGKGERAATFAEAIACDPTGDPLTQCREFQPFVDREDETLRFGDDETRVPEYDRLRELHPADRDAELERITAYPQCSSTAQCTDRLGHDLPGTQCVGRNGDEACLVDGDGDCIEGRCRPEWFVTCVPSAGVGAADGYCVDRRHSDAAAAGCFVDDEGRTLSRCDADEDGRFEPSECCTDGEACDPVTAGDRYTSKNTYDRAGALPYATRACVCGVEDERCEAFDTEVQGTDEEFPLVCEDDDRENEHAIQFVTRQGGVIYDPALKGVKWIGADRGGVPRAGVESCAEVRGLIGKRNIKDGWRAHDANGTQVENYEDFDRAMCSGQTYTVRFETDPNDEHIIDKADNTLVGKSEYTFRTAEFHVVPDSGVPADSSQINVCDALGLRFSNKPDLSPENLRKIQIFAGEARRLVAGGSNCAPTAEDQTADRVPCLTFDLSQHATGLLRFWVDPSEFTPVLQLGQQYVIDVPAVDTADASSSERAAAFVDACGMPLVLAGAQSYTYEFGIDEPACEQDEDGDEVPLSCDNAPGVTNVGQDDIDRDGTGDAEDLCPTVASSLASALDADGDGVGDACDNCRLATKQYNAAASGLALLDHLWIRNVPTQVDSDGDGIGDVCDNCVATPNCPKAADGGDPALCQLDDDGDMVGDACAGSMLTGAAGAVGLGPNDDFDQDGLVNEFDGCPRQPVEDPLPCAAADECPSGRECVKLDPDDATGSCNHLDSDGDGVGDVCDSCVGDPNPEQVMLGGDDRGFADDPDGDFVGASCEPSNECAGEANPRVLGFYEVAAAGACCTTVLVELEDGRLAERATGEALEAPNPDDPMQALPVRLVCDDPSACRALPAAVAATPGIVELPPGCDDALGGASAADNPPVTLDDAGGDVTALWDRVCMLPQRDQDFDGLGDTCDLCPFAFDPSNEEYVDEDGRTWPNTGRYCSGAYGLEATCPGPEGDTDTDTDTDTDG